LKKGFTLVELLVSMAIFMILLGAVYFSFQLAIKHWKKLSDESQHQQIVCLVMERMTTDIRAASAVLPTSNPDHLSLSVGADTIEYCLTSRKVGRKVNCRTAYLTDDDEIKILSFAHPSPRLVVCSLEGNSTMITLRNLP
jgi:prepilin-type N-terminal cleavage/methylation domain-containing protein